MMVLNFIFCITILSILNTGGGTAIVPEQFYSITIYDTDAFKSSGTENATRALISHDNTTRIFKNSKFFSENLLWKGSFLGEAFLTNAKNCRIAISYYGGYFKIMGQNGYYKMSEDGFKFYEMIIKDILRNDFIPARKTSNLR
jgi:hypothetical protein